MRKRFSNVLKELFYKQLVNARNCFGYTQNKMSEMLCMDLRSYVELDHGKTGCSATTLALYLIYVCPDVDLFLDELKEEFEADIKSTTSQ